MARRRKQQTQNLTSTLLESFERHLQAEGKDPDTVTHYCGATRQFFAFLEVDRFNVIERAEVESWLASLRERYRPASIRNRYLGLRCFCDWLAAEGELDENPFGPRGARRIKPMELPESPKDVVSAEDMARVFAHLDKHKRWRDAALIAILYDTGMRTSELADCPTDALDKKTGILILSKTKGKRTRYLQLSPTTLRYVDRYHRHERPAPEYLITGQRQKLTRSGIYDAVRRCFAEIGVSGTIGGHDLRHTSASHVAAEGVMSESDMMELYGWKEPDMVRHYTEQARRQAALNAHKRSSPMERLRDKR